MTTPNQYRTYCIVCSSKNKEDRGEGTLFAFPKCEQLKSVWMESLNIKGVKLRSRAKVCERHFSKSQCASGHLKKNAVPTLIKPEDNVKLSNPDETLSFVPIAPKPFVFQKLSLNKPTILVGECSAVPICPKPISLTPSTSQAAKLPLPVAPKILHLPPGTLSPVVFQAPFPFVPVSVPVSPSLPIANAKQKHPPVTHNHNVPAKRPRLPKNPKPSAVKAKKLPLPVPRKPVVKIESTLIKVEKDESPASGNAVVKIEKTEEEDDDEEQLYDNLVSCHLSLNSEDIDPLS